MTWLKFGIATLAFSFAISAAAAFEVVDTNNGFAGPAFTQILAEQEGGDSSAAMNSDDFSDSHIFMRSDHEKEFDGYSYSGFVFEDELQSQSTQVSIDQSSVETTSDAGKAASKH